MTKADDPARSTTHGVTPGYEDAAAPGPVHANGQHSSYWVLSAEERAKGFTRPVRRTYFHAVCKTKTSMGLAIAETYAREAAFYGATFCVACKTHSPVGPDGQFFWVDEANNVTDEKVGT